MTALDIQTLAARVGELADIEAIRLLMARYHLACDGTLETGTHRDPEAIAALFTRDGVWEIPGNTIVGREAIIAMARQLQALAWIVHFVVNPIVSVEGDVAKAEFKGFVRARFTPSSPALWSIGRYSVVAARTDGGWLFRSLAWEYLENPAADDDVALVIAGDADI